MRQDKFALYVQNSDELTYTRGFFLIFMIIHNLLDYGIVNLHKNYSVANTICFTVQYGQISTQQPDGWLGEHYTWHIFTSILI